MIGELKSEISLLEEQRVADGGGGALVVWSAGATMLAAIVWRRAAPERTGNRRRFKRRAQVTIRARDDVTFAARFEIAGSQFAVISMVEPVEARGFLVLEVEEVLL